MVARPHIAAVMLVAGLVGTAWAAPSSPTGSTAAAKKGVKIVSAYTGDTDRDGAIDRVYARFSRAVKGRPKASSFAVSGYRVTGKPRARGKTVTLQVAERPGCDVGGGPKVAFRGRGLKSGGRAVRASKIDMQRRNRSFPRITCAVTADSDRDGRLDNLVLTYSKTVRNRAVEAGGGPFTVAGYAVASVGRARGRSLTLRLRERSAPDTGARPVIEYKKPRGKGVFAVRSGKSQAFSGTYKAVRDRIAPMLVSARTLDHNADGSLDGLSTAWTEPISSPRGFSVAGAQVTATGGTGEAVDLSIAEGAHNTGARPALSFTAGTVRDPSGNAASAGTATPTDGAAPILQAARTADRGGAAGRLDTVSLAFSEGVSHAADSDGRYPFAVSGYSVVSAGGASGSGVDINLNEGSGPDTGARPAVTYSRGEGAPVVDGAGNEAVGRAFAGTTDGVAPRLLSATTLDTNLNGRLDNVRFEFSEPVNHGAEGGGGSFSATGLSAATAGAASGRIVDLALSEAALPNTGVRPIASYSRDGSNDVLDAAGNAAAGASLPAADAAAPLIVSAGTSDSSPRNGRIDRIALTFSENLEPAARDASAPYSFAAAGRSLAAAGEVSGASLELELQVSGAPDTGTAPTVQYTGGGTPMTDSSGNQSPARSYPGLTRDGAAPWRESVRTGDADTDGRIDRVDVRYSETVTGTGGFDVAGRSLSPPSTLDDTVRLPFGEAGAVDTDSRPGVTYTPGDVADEPEGPGDAPAGADAFDVSAADGVGPVIVAARTLDVDTDGILDGVRATFSEPLTHPADSAEPFALRIPDRTELNVSDPQGAQENQLTVSLAEAATPDGGFRPSVAVADASGLRDRATPANNAVPLTFTNTADGVAPRLVSAQLGEKPSGGPCGQSPAQNGRLDCVRARFSEPISHSGDDAEPFAFSLDSLTVADIPAVAEVEAIDVLIDEGTTPDRDRGANITYAGAGVTKVVDPAGNEALDTTSLATARACADDVNDGSDAEDNDTRATATLVPSDVPYFEPSRQRRCAFDDDWYRLATDGGTRLQASVRPSPGLDPEIVLYDSSGGEVARDDSDPAGRPVEIDADNLSGADYYLRVSDSGNAEGPYCMALSNTAVEPSCGPLAGELILTEGRFEGATGERFLELKNAGDFDLDTSTADLALRIGPVGSPTCDLSVPAGDAAVLSSGEYAVVTDTAGPGPFKCAGVDQLPAGGTPVAVLADDSPIDSVDFSGLLTTSLTAAHSLQVKTTSEDSAGNDNVQNNWCRTFAPHSRGAPGDGCDEYRVNEILFDPVTSGPDGNDGRAFVELAGNLPAKPVSSDPSALLGGWVLKGASGETGDGTADFPLPAGASPSNSGIYVVADAVDSRPSETKLPTGTWDVLWANLNLGNPSWPGLPGPNAGPRGLQLLRPSPPANPPCQTALADVIGWRQTNEFFSETSDSRRRCTLVEGEPMAPISTAGPSAARDNLSFPGDPTYNSANDTGNNIVDLCRQPSPDPGQLNVRPPCSG